MAPLFCLTCRVALLGFSTVKLMEILAGCWISLLTTRRRLLCVMNIIFEPLGLPEPTQVIRLSPGINIVCGPSGELCLCYLNGWELNDAQEVRVHDGDFIICWLVRDIDATTNVHLADDLLPGLNEGVHPLSRDSETCGTGHLTDSRQ